MDSRPTNPHIRREEASKHASTYLETEHPNTEEELADCDVVQEDDTVAEQPMNGAPCKCSGYD